MDWPEVYPRASFLHLKPLIAITLGSGFRAFIVLPLRRLPWHYRGCRQCCVASNSDPQRRASPDWWLSNLSYFLRREPKSPLSSCYVMMTPVLIKKILRPVVLAAAIMLMTPVAGLVRASFNAPVPVEYSSSETVIYKTNTSVAFKS